jgi:histone acetyltransferase HTATIP
VWAPILILWRELLTHHSTRATLRLACNISQEVKVGCKIYIRRPGPDGHEEERLAEILSIRDKPNNPYARRSVAASNSTPSAPEDKWEFFVHWDTFNKRLDEWVAGSRLVLSRDLEWPRPKPPPPPPKKLTGAAATAAAQKQNAIGKAPRSQSLLKKATANAAAASQVATTPAPSDSAPSSPATPTTSLKRKNPPHDDEQSQGEDEDAVGEEDPDAEGEMDVDAEGESDVTFEINVAGNGAVDAGVTAQGEVPPVFSKEQEIEKLRTSGSMTQSISEITRVKNLNKLQIGKHEVEAWYFSPYPQEYAHLDVLYICEFCLSFFPSGFMLGRHRKRCTLLHPPGNEIYRHEDISFFEIDGKKQLTYCRNLSLLSKCFLDQ